MIGDDAKEKRRGNAGLIRRLPPAAGLIRRRLPPAGLIRRRLPSLFKEIFKPNNFKNHCDLFDLLVFKK
jgi:hypothetical protein